MSGIAGIIHFDGAPAEPGQIESMTAAMKRRGPDEQTHWAQGSVALGHCMLRTTPESIEEHQPLMSQDKKLVMVWDGRLDNRDELRRDLITAGAGLRNNPDADLALQSYEIWGEASPQRLLGDFAFAVWDARQSRLFARKLQLEERLRRQGDEARRHAGDTIRQVHAQALNSLARGPVLGLAGCERVAGRYGVELRDPWADRRVLEFFLRLP